MSKYYIKQYVINDYSFQQWKDNFESENKQAKIIGYLFYTRPNKIGTDSALLNLYLINKNNYVQNGIDYEVINRDWELFFNDYQRRWVNPPLDVWLNTKNNWIKKVAHSISSKFNRSFEDALSDVYYAIVNCYNKRTVYMGSLEYLKRAITTDILMSLRKSKYYVGEISSQEVLGEDKDGNELTIEDTLIAEDDDCGQSKIEYDDLYNKCRNLMRQNFSDREIDMIITHPFNIIDRNIYARLTRFRKVHNSSEVTEEKGGEYERIKF